MPAVDSDNFDFLDLTALAETNSQCGSENGVPLTSRISNRFHRRHTFTYLQRKPLVALEQRQRPSGHRSFTVIPKTVFLGNLTAVREAKDVKKTWNLGCQVAAVGGSGLV